MNRFEFFAIVFVCFSTSFASAASSFDAATEYLAADQPAKALEILLAAKEEKGVAKMQYLLADAYLGLNDIESAIKHAENALELEPDQSEYHTVYAEAIGLKLVNEDGGFFGKLRQVRKLRKAYETAVELDPSNLRAREGLASFYTAAPGIVGGSKRRGLEQARAVFETDKQRGYPLLVAAHKKEKNHTKVRELLEDWRADYPTDWGVFFNLTLYAHEQDETEKAFFYIMEWLSMHPNHLPANYQVGRLAALTGQNLDVGEAGLIFYLGSPVQRSQPAHHHAYRRLAEIYRLKGQIDEAIVAVNKGLELAPSDKELQKLRRSL